MNEAKWNRPRTLKTYLHAPLSRRLVMLWPDFKITNYPFNDNEKHVGQESSGLILLHGENYIPFDYSKTEYSPVYGGIPIYTVNNDIGIKVAMEAFCNFDDNPSVFVRIRLINENPYPVSDKIAVFTMTGEDHYLTTATTTGYSTYKPKVGVWYLLNNHNVHDGLSVNDGKSYLVYKPSANLRAEWMEQKGICKKFAPNKFFSFAYTLAPNEEAVLYVSQHCGSYVWDFDYDAEREHAVKAWKSLLADIKVMPNTDNKIYIDIFLSQVTQAMQMLARYCTGEGAEKNWIVPRQGDVGCFIWPWEAVSFLIPLDRIGLRQYTGDAYRYFIEKWFTDDPGTPNDGKIMSLHQQWGNLNGSVIWGISEHILYTKDNDEFKYFKPYLERMLDWIQRERTRSADIAACCYKNIFPVGKSTDVNTATQHWTFTDSTNVRGIRAMLKLYEVFCDSEYAAVKAIYEDYRDTLLAIKDELYKGHEYDECFILPHQLGVPFEDTETSNYVTSGMPYLFETGFLDPKDKLFEQMENYFEKRGFFKNGLTGRMTSASSGGYDLYEEVYYTVNSEKIWINAWKKRGEMDKAGKTFDALMKYCLTKEYIVSERYSPNDEWFSPWQPNASGSGRVMTIMLDYFGE